MAKRRGAAAGSRKRSNKTSAAARKRTVKTTAAAKRSASTARSSKSAKKRAAAKPAKARKRVPAKATAPARPRPAPSRALAARKKVAAQKKKAAPRAARRKSAASKPVPKAAARKPVLVKKAAPKPAAARRRFAAVPAPARKAPSLNRDRRTIQDDDVVPMPPSTLDLDRTASAARSGRRTLLDRFEEHTETGPALTGGDIDADWESAYSVGDEAPGGDSPTPDQDIVDDIGRAVGVEYQDNEELKSEEKISNRDRHRWELDPASAEDFDEH